MLKNCLIMILLVIASTITGLFTKINSNIANVNEAVLTENIIENKNDENIIIKDEEITTNKDIDLNNEIDTNVAEEKDEEVKGVEKCIPKKFDMNFVRADFSTFEECTTVGNKYLDLGYGYFCDYFPDDCGDVYYMLTIYEANTGKEYDYHTIPIPDE